jgi:hypothetical protein
MPCENVPELADVLTMPPVQQVFAGPVEVQVGVTVGVSVDI